MTLPPRLEELLIALERQRWTGTIALNWKDGRVVAFERTEKERLDAAH